MRTFLASIFPADTVRPSTGLVWSYMTHDSALQHLGFGAPLCQFR